MMTWLINILTLDVTEYLILAVIGIVLLIIAMISITDIAKYSKLTAMYARKTYLRNTDKDILINKILNIKLTKIRLSIIGKQLNTVVTTENIKEVLKGSTKDKVIQVYIFFYRM